MPRGRKPTPTAIKLLTGNPGKRKINKREPKVTEGVGAPLPHLDAVATAEWRRLAAELAAVLTQADRGTLGVYCWAYSRWVDAENKTQETGGTIVKSPNGFPVQNPYVALANKAIEQMTKTGAELGLSPASRSRVKVPEAGDDDDQGLSGFLKLA